MKKPVMRRLHLKLDTVRALTSAQLGVAAGGMIKLSDGCPTESCNGSGCLACISGDVSACGC